jgi:serine phosphatase RsbU (regulator of sigma subunit)/anti-sigma regulatory factor (Ser/Thr protein kinase)
MRLSIRTQALLLSFIPLTAMMLVLFFALLNVRAAQDSAYWGRHSQEVLGTSAQLSAYGEQANAALADYLRTQNASDLTRMHAAIAGLRRTVTQLQTLTVDNSAQHARAAHMATLTNALVPYFDRLAALAGDPAAARRLEQSPFIIRASRDYERTQADFDREERALTIQRFQYFSVQSARFIAALIGALLVGIVVSIAGAVLFGARMVRRLLRLAQNATILADGGDPPPDTGDDEIAVLDAQYRAITMRMRKEQAISMQLQRALLPQQLPEIPGIRIDASYRSAASDEEIGGDWYDVFVLDSRTIGISLGDVSGHGLRAASTMAIVRQSIQTAARYTRDAASVMELINRTVCDQDSQIVSAYFGILNTETGKMEYAVAGHPAPITVRATGTIGMLAGSGLLLGVERNARYEKFETHVESGAAIVLYTDGLVETFRGDYSRGVSHLIDAINAEYYNTSDNIAQAIQNRVLAGTQPHDDSACVFIGITELAASTASRARTWHLDAKAVSEARRLKRAFLWHLGQFTDDETALSSVELILGELLGNVARHTQGPATVTLELSHDRAILHVIDQGAGAPIPTFDMPADELAENGRGLFLVNALARRLEIERADGGNRITAELPVTVELFSLAPERQQHAAFR